MALSVGVLGLAGCGEDDSPDPAKASAGTAATTAAKELTGPPVKILVTAAVDTQLENANGTLAAVKAAAMAIEANGGVNGRPFEISFCNNQSDPNKTGACARQAVDEKVTAVIPLATTTSSSLYPVLEAAKIPVVGSLPSSPADWESPMSFPVLPGQQILNSASPIQMQAHGLENVATVAIDVAAADNQVRAIKEASEIIGIPYAGTVRQPFTATDFSTFIQQLTKMDAKGVIVDSTDEATVSLIQAANQLGTKMVWGQVSSSMDEEVMLPPLGPLGEGILLPNGLPPVTAADTYPGMQRFLDEMKAAEEAGVKGADSLRYWSQNAWIATYAIAEVAKSIEGDVTAASLLEALEGAKDVDLLGLVNWSPGTPGPKNYPRGSNSTVYYTIAKDGTFVTDPKLPEPMSVYDKLGFK